MEETGQLSEETMEQLTPNKLGELNEILLNTQEQCQMVERLIKNQIEVKDEMITKLHKELEYYKQEAAERFVEQVMKSLIKVRKDMKKQMASNAWSDMSVEDLKREYLYIFEDLTDLLEQQNVDEYKTPEGEVFDAAKHQAKIESTSDASLDKKIKQSLSEGYTKRDKVIIPERVIVYQYKE